MTSTENFGTLEKFKILDTRSREDFEENRRQNKTNKQKAKKSLKNSCNIPFEELEPRLYELPDKDIELILVGSQESRNYLVSKGWDKLIHIPCSLCTTKSGNELPLSLFNETIEATESTTQANNNNNNNKEEKYTYIPLFDPCPILSQHMDTIMSELLAHKKDVNNNKKESVSNNNNPTINICDIGCGAGRDDIWLLWKYVRYIEEATCVDFNPSCLQRLLQLSKHVFASNADSKLNVIKCKIRGDGVLCNYPSIDAKAPFLSYNIKTDETKWLQSANKKQQSDSKTSDPDKHIPPLSKFEFYRKNKNELKHLFVGENADKIWTNKKSRTSNLVTNNSFVFKIWADEEMLLNDGRPMAAFIAQRLPLSQK
ncbi:hypothetical protein RFI_22711 [Reticulomyxa filosa]|uniref:Rhodanese domain-containing protein n=1 Tax=Reticulomyxa filosa TaxID=46433 RepID=X6MNH6_RETFI|nr:hypothetical protein RFI_22711 [Reticulomyxa filosa]|eukprot:ETO14655.1 hypothetical protein RFI_22711 [Reticulomyxa filosa]